MDLVQLRSHPKYNVVVFHAFCGMLANFMEENKLPKFINKHKIKHLSNQLFIELQKPTDRLLFELKKEGMINDDEALINGITDEVDIPEVLHLGAMGMEHFFRLTLQINDLPDVKMNTLLAQINSLLLSYGLETMDVSLFKTSAHHNPEK